MTEHRQKILLGVLGAMLLYFGGEWLWRNVVEAPLESRRLKVERLQADLDQRDDDLARARRDAEELEVWLEQSLPTDPQVARSLYQAWLLKLVGEVGLTNPHVDSGDPLPRKGLYHAISFSVQARGTLEQWTRFLFGFYRAGHLHQIRSVTLTPLGKDNQLDLALSIEALVLPQDPPKDTLSQTVSDRLAGEKLADYAVIPQRNLFGAGGGSDAADHTYVTAIPTIQGRPEVWFTVRTEDRVVKLRPGDTLQVGLFNGKLVEVVGDDVILESNGQRWLVSLGDSLAEAFALPPEF